MNAKKLGFKVPDLIAIHWRCPKCLRWIESPPTKDVLLVQEAHAKECDER